MKNHFLFHGGNYKSNIDDGEIRQPLSPIELLSIHRDPDVPHEKLDNAITGHLHMAKYDYLKDLAVDDCIFLAVLPDVTGYRGMWALIQDGYPEMEGELQLVNATEIHELHCAGDDLNRATTYGTALEVCLAEGLGVDPCGLQDTIDFEGGTLEDHHNPNAFCGGYFAAPMLAGVGQALYLRLKITKMPEEAPTDCGQCGADIGLPYFQWGVIIDDLGAIKTMVPDFCRCQTKICAGCGESPCDNNC